MGRSSRAVCLGRLCWSTDAPAGTLIPECHQWDARARRAEAAQVLSCRNARRVRSLLYPSSSPRSVEAEATVEAGEAVITDHPTAGARVRPARSDLVVPENRH